LNAVRNVQDARHPVSRLLRGDALRLARDSACEHDDSRKGSDTDVGMSDARLSPQFANHFALKACVALVDELSLRSQQLAFQVVRQLICTQPTCGLNSSHPNATR
jgi:hypothetical protein